MSLTLRVRHWSHCPSQVSHSLLDMPRANTYSPFVGVIRTPGHAHAHVLGGFLHL